MTALNNFIRMDGTVRLVGRWAWLTRIFGFTCLIILALTIGIGLPYGYRLLTEICADTCDIQGQLIPANVIDLQKIGISVDTYATIYVIILAVFTLTSIGVSALLLWKKPGEILPLSAALLIMALPSVEGQFVFFSNLFKDYPFLGKINDLISIPGPLFTTYLFLTFPNGKFNGKIFFWLFISLGVAPSLLYLYLEVFGLEFNQDPTSLSLPIAIPLTLAVIIISFFREKDPRERKLITYLLYTVICAVAIFITIVASGFVVYLFALIYRSRKVLTLRERNSAKWLIYGFSIFTSIILIFSLVIPQFPVLFAPGSYYFILFNILGFFGCGINLTGILMAILYANAFDINLVIKRTLVYSALSILIVAIYLGSVIGLQELVRILTGQQSGLAIVGATLVAALLFQPLRKAIQGFVDRRFYRGKYDAARTIAVLSARLQNETDLRTLASQLKEAVNETIQPELVTVWLKPSRPASKSQENKK